LLDLGKNPMATWSILHKIFNDVIGLMSKYELGDMERDIAMPNLRIVNFAAHISFNQIYYCNY
jgi:hypothetical protein